MDFFSGYYYGLNLIFGALAIVSYNFKTSLLTISTDVRLVRVDFVLVCHSDKAIQDIKCDKPNPQIQSQEKERILIQAWLILLKQFIFTWKKFRYKNFLLYSVSYRISMLQNTLMLWAIWKFTSCWSLSN